MRRQVGAVLGTLLLVLSLTPLASAQAEMASIRIVQAAAELPSVDVSVDGHPILTNFAFLSFNGYQSLAAGHHTVAVTQPQASGSRAPITQDIDVAAGQAYTIAVVGLANVGMQVYSDDRRAPPAGKARVRVIHLSPDAPTADVEVVNGPTLIQNLAFPDASKYIDVPAATYNLRVVAESENNVFLQLPNTEVKAATIYDVVAVGRLANIKVTVGAYAPAAEGPTAGSGTAPSAGTAALPHTGIEHTGLLTLLGMAGVLLLAGTIARRAARQLGTPSQR
jgi:LPXTG-motif cell wall-anchored protein